MKTRLLSLGALSSASLVLALAGCGGSKPPAAAPSTPAPAASATEAPTASAAPSASAAPAPTPAASDTSSSSSGSGSAEALEQPPIDLITQSGEAWVIDFEDSDIGAKAEKECKSKRLSLQAKCREHKHREFLADVLQFKKHKDGKITFTIYKRHDERLTKLSTNDVKLKQKTGHTVAVQITDNSHVPRVLFTRRRKFVVTVPNGYSVQLQDPRYGKLVYDGKVDMFK